MGSSRVSSFPSESYATASTRKYRYPFEHERSGQTKARLNQRMLNLLNLLLFLWRIFERESHIGDERVNVIRQLENYRRVESPQKS